MLELTHLFVLCLWGALHTDNCCFYLLIRSYLPTSSTAGASYNDIGSQHAHSSESGQSTHSPIYLPTTLNPTSYHTIEIHRKVSNEILPPPKDPKTIKAEV